MKKRNAAQNRNCCRVTVTVPALGKSLCFASRVVKWGGVYSVAIRSKPDKGERGSSNIEKIPERLDIHIGGWNTVPYLLLLTPRRGHAMGGKVQRRRC